jgi:hypothetical protein
MLVPLINKHLLDKTPQTQKIYTPSELAQQRRRNVSSHKEKARQPVSRGAPWSKKTADYFCADFTLS